MGRPNRWGIDPAVLKTHVYEICEQYRELTLRTLHYRLVQVYGYPNELGFYKYLSRWCSRWRREDPELNKKFVDLGRLPIRSLVPPEHLREVKLRGEALRVATELLRPIRERVEEMALKLLERGFSPKEIGRRLKGLFKFP